MKVAVVGCGYVGLVSAVGLASVGHQVIGIETDPVRRAAVAAGEPPFHEPGLSQLLSRCLSDGSFATSGDLGHAVDAEVALLAVQTPPSPDGSINLAVLRAVAASLAEARSCAGSSHDRVVAVRSTVVPGTVDTVVAPLLADVTATGRLSAASNPEFLREGSALADFLNPDRVVVGTRDPWAAARMEELYRPLGAQVVHTTPAAAELTKYASNALLATLVSFSNEIARVAEALPGVDVDDVLDTLHLDRRLQPRTEDGSSLEPAILSYLRAGCGFGGSCLPKDLSAIISHAHDLGEPVRLLQAVRDINEEQPAHLVDLTERALGDLVGRAVTVLGIAFKAGTDDLRASPGVKVVAELRRRGAVVRVHDPLVSPRALEASGVAVPAEVADRLVDAVGGAEAVVVTTVAGEFAALPMVVARLSAPPLVVDGRRLLDPDDFPAGRYVGIGRARTPVDATAGVGEPE